MAIITSEGRLGAAVGSISVDSKTGTFQASRIGAHNVVGDVDFLGNGIRNAVLESPDIRYACMHTIFCNGSHIGQNMMQIIYWVLTIPL